MIWTRRLLRCGLAAGPVFVTAFLTEGAIRDGYQPLRHPVSSLALGPGGWAQAANFAVTGTLLLAAAAGLSSAGDSPAGTQAGPVLVGAAGAGLIGSAIFPADPVSGYPPGTPGVPRAPSRAGMMHNLAALPVFLGLPAAAADACWRSARAGLAPMGAVLCWHRHHHAYGHGAGRRGVRPITPSGTSGRIVPARQYRHRLRLAHSPIRTSTPAYARPGTAGQ